MDHSLHQHHQPSPARWWLVAPALALLASCHAQSSLDPGAIRRPAPRAMIAPARPRCDFGHAGGEASDVSLAEVLESVASYHGKRVRFRGVARLEFEHSLVYPTRPEYEDDLPRHALWFGWPRREWVLAERACGGRDVVVVGVVDARAYGRRGKFRGGIIVEQVSELEASANGGLNAPLP